MRAMTARAVTCALDVEVRWGDGALLASEHLRGDARYLLSSEPLQAGATGFVVQRDWLVADSVTLVASDEGRVLVSPPDAEPFVLLLGEQTLVLVGSLVVRIAVVEPRMEAAARSWRERLTPRDQRWTLASLVLHGLALGCMVLMPPRASSLSLDTMSEDTRYLRYLNTPVAREPELPWSSAADGAQAPVDPGKRAADDSGAAGKPDVARSHKRLAVQGDADTRQLARTPSAAEVRTAGLLGVLNSASASLGPSSPFGPDKPVGYDPSSALGQLFGASIGDDFGFNGLANKGTGRGGGGDGEGTIGLGDTLGAGLGAEHVPGVGSGHFGPRRAEHVPTLRMHPAEVRGSLSKEVIRRAIHRRLNEVRFCYESALAHNPTLHGRLAVSFLIAPSGAVQQAIVKESTLDSKVVSDCVTSAVRRFSFPAPDGGGYVQVTYPFSFAAE